MYYFKNIEPYLPADGKITGNTNQLQFDKALPFDKAGSSTLCWLKEGAAQKLNAGFNGIVICSIKDTLPGLHNDAVAIQVENPRLVFLRIIKNVLQKEIKKQIHRTAVIDPEAILSEEIYIGPNCIIGKCEIGKNVVLHGNSTILDSVKIGDNVTIMTGCVIGGTGFGYEKNERGEFELFPHIGGVIIENNVDIGANTCIDRGTLGDTVIGEGTKVDNLVHIAHNVVIGKNCAIIAQAMIGGGTVIQDGAWIAPASALRDGIIIGKNVVVGLGAVVTKNIPDSEVWMGNPARKK